MSKFKVGDRVKCTCGDADACTVQGRVVGIEDNGEARVACDNGEEVTWRTKYLALVAPAPPVAVAPTLETATQPNYEVKFSEDGRYVTVVAHNLPKLPPPVLTFTAVVPRAPSGIDRDVADYVAEHDAQRAALEAVRVFLGSHSFASCSLACNRELREVMAVVLAALDADKAAK